MWKALIEYAMRGVSSSPKDTLIKLQWLFVAMITAGVVSAISLAIAEYYLADSGFTYLSETLGYSDSSASLLIGCMFLLQTLILFSIVVYKINSIMGRVSEGQNKFREITEAFVEGFKNTN